MIIVSKKKLSEMNNNSTEKNIIQEGRKLNICDDTRNKRTDEYDTEVLVSYSQYTDEGPSYPQVLRYMRSSDIGKFDNVVKCDRCGKYMTGGVGDDNGRYCNTCGREITLRSIISDPRTDKALRKTVKGDGIIQEAEDEKTFEVQYTVKFTKKVSAKSASEAQKKIRDEYKDQSVMITSTKEVEDDLTEDLEKDVAMDNKISAELSDNHRAFFSLINDLIIGELDTINAYNGAIVTAKDLGLESASKLIQDISDEETRHIGELQHLMKTITPQAQEIPNGENEATEKMQDFEDGVDDNVDGVIGANSPLWKQTSAIVLDDVDDDIMGIESYL